MDLERPPWGLTTTTGINTVVLAETENGYIVRSPCGYAVPVIGGTLVTDIQIAIDPGHGGLTVELTIQGYGKTLSTWM